MQKDRGIPQQTRIQDRLAQVYWLGGSPCSGKSSVANLIAARCAVDVYHIDEAVMTRLGPYDAQAHPCMHRWTAGLSSGNVTWDALWMRPADELLSEVFECYDEQFRLVVADILQMQPVRPLLVEGNPLLPERVLPLAAKSSHAVWMVATESFQRQMYPQRGSWVRDILAQCREPDAAQRNWMDRDVSFAEKVAEAAASTGGTLIRVDGARTLDETALAVAERFGLEPVSRGYAE